MHMKKLYLLAFLIILILIGCSQEPEMQLSTEPGSVDGTSWVIKWDNEWVKWAKSNKRSIIVTGIELHENNCKIRIPMQLDESVQIKILYVADYVSVNITSKHNTKYECNIQNNDLSFNKLFIYPVYDHHPYLTKILPDPDERLPIVIPLTK